MDLSSKLAVLAKRLPAAAVGGEFEILVRAIGEAKSKSEEDAIIQRMIDLSKQQIKEGLPRKGDNTRALKDLLVYLVYINMLGHDTGWASAAVIQLCSHRSLVVKKTAYLATSLLIDPSSELMIMVTATIQADLKSDNFLIVCTALHAIAHSAGPDVVGVFLPQIVSLLRHDRDQVKKKALLALHRLVQVDASITSDIERHFIEKLGYKEPSVMVAALCGLHQLIKIDPKPYSNLIHYFTNILKQASEGKLGRSWDYHRAPAPFVQIELLRLLSLLGSGNASATANMKTVIMDVWKRAESLPSTVGNCLVYECMKTATSVSPSDDLLSLAMHSVARFLVAKDNNLRYAGIDILSRIVDGHAERVQQYQLAIVECLRSPDITLKRKTLECLFKMAGPENIEVVAEEAMAYIKDSGDDDAPRRHAAYHLLSVAERCAPSFSWFADISIELLDQAGDVAPPSAADALIRVVAGDKGTPTNDSILLLRQRVARRCFGLLDRPKLPPILLKTVCWVLGEYGSSVEDASHSRSAAAATVIAKIAAIPETQSTATPETLAAVAVALGKLGMTMLIMSAGRTVPPAEAFSVLESLASSESLEVQQVAAEALALLKAPPAIQRAALRLNSGNDGGNGGGNGASSSAFDEMSHLYSVENDIVLSPSASAPASAALFNDINVTSDTKALSIDPSLPFLDAFVQRAADNGAPPYLSLDERVAMGISRAPEVFIPMQAAAKYAGSSALKFQAYEVTPLPAPGSHALNTKSEDAPRPGSLLIDDLDLSGLSFTEAQEQYPSSGSAAASAQHAQHAPPPPKQQQEEFVVHKQGGRKWGVHAAPPKDQPGTFASPSSPYQQRQPQQQSPASSLTKNASRNSLPSSASAVEQQPEMSPEQRRLAASLFGGGSANKKIGTTSRKDVQRNEAVPVVAHNELDLLGDDLLGSSSMTSASDPVAKESKNNNHMSNAAMLDDFFGMTHAEQQQHSMNAPMASASDVDVLSSLAGLNMSGNGGGVSGGVSGGGGSQQQQAAFGFDMLDFSNSTTVPHDNNNNNNKSMNTSSLLQQQQPNKSNAQDPFANLL